jgi:hypothetical protein
MRRRWWREIAVDGWCTVMDLCGRSTAKVREWWCVKTLSGPRFFYVTRRSQFRKWSIGFLFSWIFLGLRELWESLPKNKENLGVHTSHSQPETPAYHPLPPITHRSHLPTAINSLGQCIVAVGDKKLSAVFQLPNPHAVRFTQTA